MSKEIIRFDRAMFESKLDAMAREEDDLLRYVNLFGYNPKYGVSGPRISSITYLPQGRFTGEKLYHQKAPALL